MAFDRTNLALTSASQNSGQPRTWSYSSSDDTVATMNTASYFDNASDLLGVGDVIISKDSAGSIDRLYVNANSGGVVDVDDGTALDGGTDTD